MTYIHPARRFPYDVIVGNLERLRDQGYVSEKVSGDHSLFCYTQKTTFDREWNPFTQMARGLIIDRNKKEVVATPFEKFFNLLERPNEVHNRIGDEFDALEKHDGSLIIIWNDGEGWRTCTKGSFDSDQAKAARDWIARSPGGTLGLYRGWTYCAEWVSPTNKIVIPYAKDELILLAVFKEDGHELNYNDTVSIGDALGWRVAARQHFEYLSEVADYVATLPATQEGFVVRYPNGYRLKIKGAEYLRVHRLISNCTPLAIWESMAEGDDISALRRELPEEFWEDFDSIVRIIQRCVHTIVYETADIAYRMASMSDKEVGLSLYKVPEPYRGLIFPFRKNGGFYMNNDSRLRKAVFKIIRPTGNFLDGYVPSSSMHRVVEETG